MIIEGIVHGIAEVESVAIDTETGGLQPGADWGALGEYPLKRTTRAQRKADRACEKPEPRVSLLCDVQPRMVTTLNGPPFRMPPWRRAPRTHAPVNCMSCLVAQGRT